MYSCNENGINLRVLPQITLVALSQKSVPGFKIAKRLYYCNGFHISNLDGSHKFPLLRWGNQKLLLL